MNNTKAYAAELLNILHYWATVVYDETRGRFYGRVDENNVPDKNAPLGSVMYARALWAFSAGYQETKNPRDLLMAGKAYQYLTTVFWDKTYGGVYWLIDADEKVLADKKQVYALAFSIYGLAEYYKVNPDDKVLDQAKELYWLIERYSYDPVNDGYLEAFNRDWSAAGDLRLSQKDHNEQKTMNTHLHIMEAYTNLYQVWPEPGVAKKILKLISLFQRYFINPQSWHLSLFFNETWENKADIISYGHDIEASWLLCEAANLVGSPELIADTRKIAVNLVDATMPGFDINGGLNYETEAGVLIAQKHWWVQAEAAVGLVNAWQLTGKAVYMNMFNRCWEYITKNIIDTQNGEWFWGIQNGQQLMPAQDKAGIWKCPYHNSRCILEIMKRLP